MVTRDPSPTADEFSAEACDFLAAHQASQLEEGKVLLLESTIGRVIPLAGENEQGYQHDNVEDVEPHDLDEGGGDAEVGDKTKERDRVVQDEEVNIVVDEVIQAIVAVKPKVQKKRRRGDGASCSDHPLKKLRVDHDTSSEVSANTGGKSLAAIQELFERSTLNVEVGILTAATVPFVTSSVISSDSSHHSSTNAADVEVTSIVRSLLPPPPMRTEHYFLMTDYSLWERLARKNELKARGTLLMALPDKHQLKFNTHKDAKNLMEAIEKRFEGNTETKKVQKTLIKQQYENFTGSSSESLDQIHDRLQKLISQLEILGVSLSQEDINLNLKIYEAEVKSYSFARTSMQNIAFVSSSNINSTNEPVSAAASVSSVSAKIHVFALPTVDTLSNAVIYLFFASQSTSPQLDNDDLKQIDTDDLEEMDLKWKMAMLTVRVRRFLQRTGRNLGENGPTSMVLICRRWSVTTATGKDTLQGSVVMTEVFKQMRNLPTLSWHSHLQVLLLTMRLRDNALVVLRQNLEKAEQERDDLKLKLEKFQTSSKNLSELLASQTNDKTGLVYNSQVFTRAMFDCDDYLTSESDESLPPSPIYDRYQSGNGYHAVPLTYTGTFMPPKPDLIFHNAPNAVETVHTAFNVKLSLTKPDNDLSHTRRPSAPIIEDWVSDSEDESETKLPQNVPTATPKTTSLKPKSQRHIRNRKACFVCKSLTHLIKDYEYHEKKMAQTPTRNHALRGHHKQYARMSLLNLQRHVVPIAVLTQSKLVPITAARPVPTAVPKIIVTRPRQAKTVVTKPNSPPKRHINHSPSPKASNFPPKVTAIKAPMVNAAKVVQEK
nr:hypothetical protein [Tanacetum cinerariifolium]